MSLQRFSVYFLSISACAVVLFPRMAPPATATAPLSLAAFRGSIPPQAQEMTLMAFQKAAPRHPHLRLAPATIVASN